MKRFEYQTKNRLDRLMKLLSFSQLAKLSKESFYSTCCGFNHRNEQKTKQRFLKFTHWTNSMNIRCWKLLNENTVERIASTERSIKAAAALPFLESLAQIREEGSLLIYR